MSTIAVRQIVRTSMDDHSPMLRLGLESYFEELWKEE